MMSIVSIQTQTWTVWVIHEINLKITTNHENTKIRKHEIKDKINRPFSCFPSFVLS
jgi:hypothetical protein